MLFEQKLEGQKKKYFTNVAFFSNRLKQVTSEFKAAKVQEIEGIELAVTQDMQRQEFEHLCQTLDGFANTISGVADTIRALNPKAAFSESLYRIPLNRLNKAFNECTYGRANQATEAYLALLKNELEQHSKDTEQLLTELAATVDTVKALNYTAVYTPAALILAGIATVIFLFIPLVIAIDVFFLFTSLIAFAGLITYLCGGFDQLDEWVTPEIKEVMSEREFEEAFEEDMPISNIGMH